MAAVPFTNMDAKYKEEESETKIVLEDYLCLALCKDSRTFYFKLEQDTICKAHIFLFD